MYLGSLQTKMLCWAFSSHMYGNKNPWNIEPFMPHAVLFPQRLYVTKLAHNTLENWLRLDRFVKMCKNEAFSS